MSCEARQTSIRLYSSAKCLETGRQRVEVAVGRNDNVFWLTITGNRNVGLIITDSYYPLGLSHVLDKLAALAR